jgi:hypothetical protein
MAAATASNVAVDGVSCVGFLGRPRDRGGGGAVNGRLTTFPAAWSSARRLEVLGNIFVSGFFGGDDGGNVEQIPRTRYIACLTCDCDFDAAELTHSSRSVSFGEAERACHAARRC